MFSQSPTLSRQLAFPSRMFSVSSVEAGAVEVGFSLGPAGRMEDFVNESPGSEAVLGFGGGGGGFGSRSGADAWLDEEREAGVKLLDLIVVMSPP
jgi:hypothetical protein